MRGTFIRSILLIDLLLLLYNVSVAQFNSRPLHITEENGLSDNNIKCIYKDHNNFFWVGTLSGLNLINGSAITVFKNIPGDNTSIDNNHILSITEDRKGILWIGTPHGLNAFDQATRKFSRIPLVNNSNAETESAISIAVSKSDQVYVGTSQGLFVYDPVTRKTRSIEIPGNNNEKLKNNRITHLDFDRNGLLYLCTYSGLWSYDESTHHFSHVINDPSLFINFIFDHLGNLWVGTWDSRLIKWDPIAKREQIFKLNNSDNILTIAEVRRPSGYTIMTNGFFLNPDAGKKGFILIPRSTFGNVNKVLFNPGDNRLWVGSDRGLYLINESGTQFTYRNFKHSITPQNVSIYEWNHQYLVGGAGNDFLKLFDKNLEETADYSTLIPDKSTACLMIREDGSNRIKCGTTNGVMDIDLSNRKAAFHFLHDTSTNQEHLAFINCLFRDSQNTWWLFPWRNGIWTREANTTTPKKVFNNFITSLGQPKPLVISDACEDRNGNLWMSDYDEGIIHYNSNTHTFSKPFADSLGQYYACSQILYHNGYCYSFLSTTLLIWNTDSMKLHKVPLLPLRDKAISSIALDSAGHVWMATRNGLIAYSTKDKSLLHFTIADGLTSNQLIGTLYCAQDGTMLFGEPSYLFSFRPEDLLNQIRGAPEMKLSEVIVDDNSYHFDSSGNNSFRHTQNNFIFRWTVTDYTDPLNNHYYYQLEGIDKGWRNAGTKGEAEFANLSPGNYTLLLKGENSNGVVANKILKMQFVILPPFWNTWWFITLLFILVAFFFYAMYRYRMNQLLRVEKLRDRISLNLHDDIGSTLSSISILSEMALHRNTDNESEKMLDEIKENSLVMMDRMDDIVWSINPKNDSLENLFARIRVFAGRLFEAKEIEYNINIDENIRHVQLNMEYRQHIYLIMKEAINNIIKHADCTEAKINASYKAPWLEIVISDNGKGIQINQTTGGNGLYSMKKRASEIKGEIKIQPGVRNGTTVSLRVKIK